MRDKRQVLAEYTRRGGNFEQITRQIVQQMESPLDDRFHWEEIRGGFAQADNLGLQLKT